MKELEEYFKKISLNREPANLYNPIYYTLSQGGKRLRPRLVMMSTRFFGGDEDAAIHPAAAFEMLHNFTLIHDDIMDNAPIRRGQPTVYKHWNSNIAILSGDALATLALREMLYTPTRPETDFGKNIIPAAIRDRNVHRYLFRGYWRDIGTIRAFWQANMELTGPLPEFNLYNPRAPLYTHMRFLPPSKINCCDLNRALLSEGCIISGHRILSSIIGVRAIVGEGSVLEHTVMMGADYYDHERPDKASAVPLGVGRDCFIRNAIIDKNARIGDGCYITPDGKPDGVHDLYTVQDGIIVIPKNTVIPPGTRL